MELTAVRAVVTGAARGLGACFARELVRAGAQVAAGDLDRAGLRQLRASVSPDDTAAGGRVLVLPLDVTDEAAVARFLEQAGREIGALNVLINNAGILRDSLLVASEADGGVRMLPTSLWRNVIDTNLGGPFLMARAFAAELLADGRSGVVVNVSSLARSGNPGQSSYAAAKSGLDAATRSWALELASHGIRVAGVAPGLIDTPIVEHIADAALGALIAGIPLGRMGRPEEIWQAVRFAIECEFFTGRTLEVDGGASLG